MGTNALIQQGAKAVTCCEDILEELNFNISDKSVVVNRINAFHPSVSPQDDRNLPNKTECDIYGLISKEPISLDGLCEKSKFSIPVITSIVLGLEFKKLIRALPGKQFIRS